MSAKIYDYAKICNSIFSIDQKIRFVGVINERGRLVAGGMKENVEPLESEKDDEMIFSPTENPRRGRNQEAQHPFVLLPCLEVVL